MVQPVSKSCKVACLLNTAARRIERHAVGAVRGANHINFREVTPCRSDATDGEGRLRGVGDGRRMRRRVDVGVRRTGRASNCFRAEARQLAVRTDRKCASLGRSG